jgi:CubicO group peptidase (beta-lactamase class C family)
MLKPVLPAIALLLAGADQPALAVPSDFAAKADAYIKSAWPADGPGASVIVTESGKTVYAKGQGLADLEAKTPITPATSFRIGSITKQFSAAVLLQLVQEGKVSLDDLVSKYVPSLKQAGGSATIRQILNHTSGVQSYTGIPGWMVEENTNRAHTTDQMIALFKDLPSPSKPGEAWAYNNSGYVLVGAVIEAVTGKLWHQAVEERIAMPLRLRTIRYGVGEAGFADMANGYTRGEDGPELAKKIHMSVPHAAGALVGSVEDLASWGQALHHGKVLGKDLYAAMIAPTPVPGEKEPAPYGFGLGLEKVRGRPAIGHGGGIFGFSTDSLYIPEKDIFVAVFANSDDPATAPSVATARLAALALGDPYPEFKEVAVDIASLEPVLGVYKTENGERRFFARDGQLYTQRGEGPEMKVYAAGDDRFFYGPNSLTWFGIHRNSGGPHAMEMFHNGSDEAEVAAWSGPVPPPGAALAVPRATLERYVGDYTIGGGRVAIAWGTGDTITIAPPGDMVRPLRPISATRFAVEGVGATVTFHEAAGAVTHLVAVMPNGPELKAERVKD